MGHVLIAPLTPNTKLPLTSPAMIYKLRTVPIRYAPPGCWKASADSEGYDGSKTTLMGVASSYRWSAAPRVPSGLRVEQR